MPKLPYPELRFVGPDIGSGVVDCIESIDQTVEAYQIGERNIGILASHAIGATQFLVNQAEAINQLNADADVVFSNACFEDRFWPAARIGWWATETSLLIGGVGQGIRGAREITIGRNWRFAPLGNKTSNPLGRYPHYHRRGIDPITGESLSGQGIGRHRPWETKSTDSSFWDRF